MQICRKNPSFNSFIQVPEEKNNQTKTPTLTGTGSSSSFCQGWEQGGDCTLFDRVPTANQLRFVGVSHYLRRVSYMSGGWPWDF